MPHPHPTIDILHGVQGAKQARGVAVVIDVLRAFSTACYVLAAGARRMLTVADADAALNMRDQYPGAVLIGERDGFRLPGFDLGNSPSQVSELDWLGRTAIMTTSNGTLGLAAASNADQVLAGSFVNAGAIVDYIRGQAPSTVSLVCMGSRGRQAGEDTLCAEFIRSGLTDGMPDFEPLRQKIWRSPEAARFQNGRSDDFPREDLTRCLELNRFHFILQARKDINGVQELKRIQIEPSQ